MSSFSAGSVSLDRREAEGQGQGQKPPGPEATALDKGGFKSFCKASKEISLGS